METHTVLSALHYIATQLNTAFADTHLCQQYAWWLIEKLCQKTKTELIAQHTITLNKEQQHQLKQWLTDIINEKKPIQYILGSVPFNDLDILVEPPTLIPRPETEEWSANLIDQLKKLHNQKLTILDLATGSGCIGLSIAYHLPQAHIIATDIAQTALTMAKKNAIHNSIHTISFIQSDLFTTISPHQRFDLIVSNPPYIAESERHSLDHSVTNWEDTGALFAQDNGLDIIKKMITQAPQYIQPNVEMLHANIPQIMLEIGHKQGTIVRQLMIDAGYNNVYIYKDLEKKDRVVVGRTDHVATTNP